MEGFFFLKFIVKRKATGSVPIWLNSTQNFYIDQIRIIYCTYITPEGRVQGSHSITASQYKHSNLNLEEFYLTHGRYDIGGSGVSTQYVHYNKLKYPRQNSKIQNSQYETIEIYGLRIRTNVAHSAPHEGLLCSDLN